MKPFHLLIFTAHRALACHALLPLAHPHPRYSHPASSRSETRGTVPAVIITFKPPAQLHALQTWLCIVSRDFVSGHIQWRLFPDRFTASNEYFMRLYQLAAGKPFTHYRRTYRSSCLTNPFPPHDPYKQPWCFHTKSNTRISTNTLKHVEISILNMLLCLNTPLSRLEYTGSPVHLVRHFR